MLRHAKAVLAMTDGLDTSVPNVARVYNYWLGGKDHFSADRAEAQRLMALYPPLPALVRENRAFLITAVTWAARQGIGQFIDLGAGLPTSTSSPVHQAARAVLPAARVVYVDIDPVVLAHATALLATDDGVAAIGADLRDPAAVLGHPDLRAVIDPARPACVILGAVLHFLDPNAACAVTAGYVSLLAPGSYLIISCARFDDDQLAKQLAAEYTAATWYNHSPADITGFFDGLELAAPGVTEARTWPRQRTGTDDRHGHVLAGVGRVLGM
jgi:O-methyltransferase involved in polyketide biosynthesis